MQTGIKVARSAMLPCLIGLSAVLWAAVASAQPPAAAPDAAKPRQGKLVRIPLPIESGDEGRLRRLIERTVEPLPQQTPRHVLVLEFYAKPSTEPGKADEFAQGSKFGPAYELAKFLSELSQVQKIAYVPKVCTGHAVLVAMACDEIHASPEAVIGRAGAAEEGAVDPVRKQGYVVIHERRKTIPLALALGMLDRQQVVYRVETDAGRHFVLGDELEEFRKSHLVKGEPAVVVERGQFGAFTGSEGRTLGFVKFLPRSREHLERELELAPGSLIEDPSLGGQWRTMQVTLAGTLRPIDFKRAQSAIEDGIRNRQVNFIVVRLESGGGDPERPEGFVDMANYLAERNSGEIRTVAYVAKEARGASVLVALACDHLVVCPDAKLGGEGDFRLSIEVAGRITQTLKQSLSPAKNRSWSLPAALVDPSLEVYRYTRQGERNILADYFTREEAAQRSKEDGQDWQQGEVIKRVGEPLLLTGTRARELGLATHVVDDFSGLKETYHLDEDPDEPKPNWAMQLIEALSRPELAWLLLMIGFVAMYIELHTPGVGVAGFISGMCFLVYFWGQFLNGTAEWLEVLLFLGGILCVLFELFVVPGFGVFGFGGAAMIVASLVLASQTFILPHSEFEMVEFRDSLMAVGLGLAGCVVLGLAVRRYLPRAPLFGRMMLRPLEGQGLAALQEREALVDLTALVGRHGVATTPLAPAGIARVDDETIHVVSEGDFVPRGAEIVVIEAQGSRAVVRQVERT